MKTFKKCQHKLYKWNPERRVLCGKHATHRVHDRDAGRMWVCGKCFKEIKDWATFLREDDNPAKRLKSKLQCRKTKLKSVQKEFEDDM